MRDLTIAELELLCANAMIEDVEAESAPVVIRVSSCGGTEDFLHLTDAEVEVDADYEGKPWMIINADLSCKYHRALRDCRPEYRGWRGRLGSFLLRLAMSIVGRDNW